MKKLVLNGLKFIALILLALIINSLPILMIGNQKNFSPMLLWLIFITYLVFVAVSVRFLWKYYKDQRKSQVSLRIGWRDFGIVLLWYLAGRVVAVGGTQLVSLMTGQTSTANDAALASVAESMKGGFLPLSLAYVAVVTIFAPVVEELVYRGLGTELLTFKGSKWIPAILTSLAFGLTHVTNAIELLVYFSLGLLFYLCYRRRDNLGDSMLFHFLNNLPMGIVMLISLFS